MLCNLLIESVKIWEETLKPMAASDEMTGINRAFFAFLEYLFLFFLFHTR